MATHNVTIQTLPDDPVQTFWITKLSSSWNKAPIYNPQAPLDRSGLLRTYWFIQTSAQLKELLHTFYDDMLQRNRVADDFRKGDHELFIDPFHAAKIIEGQIAEIRSEVRRLYPFGQDNQMSSPWIEYAFVLMDGDLPSVKYEKERDSGVCKNVTDRGRWWKRWIGWPPDRDQLRWEEGLVR